MAASPPGGYGTPELGLAGKSVAVWVYEGTLRLEYESVLLARYGVEHERDGKHIREVTNPRLATTRYQSPQLSYLTLGRTTGCSSSGYRRTRHGNDVYQCSLRN